MSELYSLEYLARCERQVKERGWMVQGVYRPRQTDRRCYAYTVGLSSYGLPELLVFSLRTGVADALLNDLARHMLTAQSVGIRSSGRIELCNWRTPLFLLPADSELAGAYTDPALLPSSGSDAVLQVVWPDRTGRFPWEDGADQTIQHLQPLLSVPFLAQVP